MAHIFLTLLTLVSIRSLSSVDHFWTDCSHWANTSKATELLWTLLPAQDLNAMRKTRVGFLYGHILKECRQRKYPWQRILCPTGNTTLARSAGPASRALVRRGHHWQQHIQKCFTVKNSQTVNGVRRTLESTAQVSQAQARFFSTFLPMTN